MRLAGLLLTAAVMHLVFGLDRAFHYDVLQGDVALATNLPAGPAGTIAFVAAEQRPIVIRPADREHRIAGFPPGSVWLIRARGSCRCGSAFVADSLGQVSVHTIFPLDSLEVLPFGEDR